MVSTLEECVAAAPHYPRSAAERKTGTGLPAAPFGDTFSDTSAPERTEAMTEHLVLPEKQAEGTGFEPATGCPAPHFQSTDYLRIGSE